MRAAISIAGDAGLQVPKYGFPTIANPKPLTPLAF